MKAKPRPMQKYKPRRRRSNKELQKQQLKDFEHLLEMDLSCLLVLSEEGTSKQVEKARKKMKNALEKYECELEAIGRDLGAGFPEIIREYVQSMNAIITHSDKIDPKLINTHREQAERLKNNAN